MKFLVLWQLDINRLGAQRIQDIRPLPKYGQSLEKPGKLENSYRVVGSHRGAWI